MAAASASERNTSATLPSGVGERENLRALTTAPLPVSHCWKASRGDVIDHLPSASEQRRTRSHGMWIGPATHAAHTPCDLCALAPGAPLRVQPTQALLMTVQP